MCRGNSGRGEGVRRGHEGPDVLHLHPGPPLENEGGPRAYVCVPWDCGLCARVVPGGAGEDFGRGCRGEEYMLVAQGNLAITYQRVGRVEEALKLYRDVYSGELKLYGAEHRQTLVSANNYASSLVDIQRFKEAKSLLCRTVPVARRVLGENIETTLRLRSTYAEVLYSDDDATLGDLHEAVTTLEETERTARRVFGSEHPLTKGIERTLRESRAALSARDDASAVCGALEAMNAT